MPITLTKKAFELPPKPPEAESKEAAPAPESHQAAIPLVEENIRQLIAWGKEHLSEQEFIAAEVEANFSKFLNRYKERYWHLEEYDYIIMQSFLEDIHHSLAYNSKVLLSQKKTTYKNLVYQLGVCPTGVFNSLEAIKRELDVKVGFDQWLHKLRLDNVSLVANELNALLYGPTHGHYSHVLPAVMEMANERGFGVSEKSGYRIKDTYRDDVLARFEARPFVEAELDEIYNVTSVIRSLSVDAANYIYDKIEAIRQGEEKLSYEKLSPLFKRWLTAINCSELPLDLLLDVADKDTPPQSVLALTDGDYAILPKSSFLAPLQDYVALTLFENNYLQADKVYRHDLEEEGAVLISYDFRSDFTWVKLKDGSLRSYQRYFLENPELGMPDEFRVGLVMNELERSREELEKLNKEYSNLIRRQKALSVGDRIIEYENRMLDSIDRFFGRAERRFPNVFGEGPGSLKDRLRKLDEATTVRLDKWLDKQSKPVQGWVISALALFIGIPIILPLLVGIVLPGCILFFATLATIYAVQIARAVIDKYLIAPMKNAFLSRARETPLRALEALLKESVSCQSLEKLNEISEKIKSQLKEIKKNKMDQNPELEARLKTSMDRIATVLDAVRQELSKPKEKIEAEFVTNKKSRTPARKKHKEEILSPPVTTHETTHRLLRQSAGKK